VPTLPESPRSGTMPPEHMAVGRHLKIGTTDGTEGHEWPLCYIIRTPNRRLHFTELIAALSAVDHLGDSAILPPSYHTGFI